MKQETQKETPDTICMCPVCCKRREVKRLDDRTAARIKELKAAIRDNPDDMLSAIDLAHLE